RRADRRDPRRVGRAPRLGPAHHRARRAARGARPAPRARARRPRPRPLSRSRRLAANGAGKVRGRANVRLSVGLNDSRSGGAVRKIQAGPTIGLIAQVLLLAVLSATVGLSAAGWIVGLACALTMTGGLMRGLARGRGNRLA